MQREHLSSLILPTEIHFAATHHTLHIHKVHNHVHDVSSSGFGPGYESALGSRFGSGSGSALEWGAGRGAGLLDCWVSAVKA